MNTSPQPQTAASEFIAHSPAPQANPPEALQLVPSGLRPSWDLSDIEREVAIKHAGREVEEAMSRYAESGNFADRGDADRARLRMEALIRGRSPEFVQQLEQARGLA